MTEHEWDETSPIPLALWGRDHWSTLAFLESYQVNGGGTAKLEGGLLDHLRCNPRRHRTLLGTHMLNVGAAWDEKYGTRLSDDTMIPKHDDWDCVNDFVAAGVAVIVKETAKTGQVFVGGTIHIRLTTVGHTITAALRLHKANGGAFGNFACATTQLP